ncbi:MAG: hypothetical protein EXS16_00535 [Gemmataceae bacterium]|nr:hypothetical protein [Gemmataceae bacterium]
MGFVRGCVAGLAGDTRTKVASMVNDRRLTWQATSALLCPLLYLALGNVLSGGQPKIASDIAPDEKIQASIHRIIMAKDDDDKEARAEKVKLDSLARKSPEILAPQLIYYKMHVKTEQEGLRSLGMMACFTKTWDSELRSGLISLLETRDGKIYTEVCTWLNNIDVGSRIDAESKLMSYRETLLGRKEAPPRGLVGYVYEVSPRRDLLLFGEIYSEKPKFGDFPRDLVWSDHVITTVKWRLLNRFLQEGDLEKAQKELDTLSKHKGWYARRYVVETMRQTPKLGTPEITERLKKDANPLVADPAKLIE